MWVRPGWTLLRGSGYTAAGVTPLVAWRVEGCAGDGRGCVPISRPPACVPPRRRARDPIEFGTNFAPRVGPAAWLFGGIVRQQRIPGAGGGDVATGRASFRDGVRASAPIVFGYAPIGFSFGVAATDQGFAAAEAIFLSLVIYSGASQFMALTLLSGGTAVIVSIVTLLATNVRHVFYGPALLDRIGRGAKLRRAWAWAYGLTDEVFAATIGFLASGSRPWSERWMLGIGVSSFLAWGLGTALGAMTGGGALSAYPAVEAALGFMLPALFLALLLSILDRRQVPVVVAAGGTCAVVALTTGATAGVLAGMVAGAVVGGAARTRAATEAA